MMICFNNGLQRFHLEQYLCHKQRYETATTISCTVKICKQDCHDIVGRNLKHTSNEVIVTFIILFEIDQIISLEMLF